MPKSRFDWKKIEALCGEPLFKEPQVVFGPAIGKEVGAMMSRIRQADQKRSKLPVALQRIVDRKAENETAQKYFADQYVKAMAVLQVFKQIGVLDPFYEAMFDEDQQAITKEGWMVTLPRPRSSGIVQVQFVDPTPEFNSEVEKVIYQAA